MRTPTTAGRIRPGPLHLAPPGRGTVRPSRRRERRPILPGFPSPTMMRPRESVSIDVGSRSRFSSPPSTSRITNSGSVPTRHASPSPQVGRWFSTIRIPALSLTTDGGPSPTSGTPAGPRGRGDHHNEKTSSHDTLPRQSHRLHTRTPSGVRHVHQRFGCVTYSGVATPYLRRTCGVASTLTSTSRGQANEPPGRPRVWSGSSRGPSRRA